LFAKASLEIFEEAGIENLREKSFALTGYLEKLIDEHLPEIEIVSPRDPLWRGCQLSLRFTGFPEHIKVEDVHKALAHKNITVDARRPNIMRVAPVPLYNKFIHVNTFVRALKQIRKTL